MRKIKIEYTAFDYKEIPPNKSFFAELSRQITPKIVKLVVNNAVCEILPDLICLSVIPDSYGLPAYQDGINSMRMNISSRSTSLIICEVFILWYVTPKYRINPWDDLRSTPIYFDLLIQNSEIKALNAMLPQLYHPLIKSKSSGLPFDYQIYYGGDTLNIFTHQPISQNDIDLIDRIIHDFSYQWNSVKGSKIYFYDVQIQNRTCIKLHVDWSECDTEAVESMICCFSGIDNIKKIIFR